MLERLVKLVYLPNSARFSIEKEGYNRLGLMLGILKTDRDFLIEKFDRISRHNLYLRRTYHRLWKHAKARDYPRFQALMIILLERSVIYRLAQLNKADPKWMTRSRTTTEKTLRWIGKAIKERNPKLDYHRWWIDKQPGDAARPIGAPTLPWKTILRMVLLPLDILYKGNGVIKDWQHAGSSRRGLLTAWEDVYNNALNSRYIFEFDLKGFFNEVSNQNALQELPEINAWFNKLSNAKPTGYHLPPIEKDEAAKAYKPFWTGTTPKMAFVRNQVAAVLPNFIKRLMLQEEGENIWEMTAEEFNEFYYSRREIADYDTAHPEVRKGLEEIAEREYDKYVDKDLISLRKEYKKLKNGELVRYHSKHCDLVARITNDEDIETERGLGRDDWAGLGRENHGFPQGANTSPFLSCLQVFRVVGHLENIIMYMDDGLIYGRTEGEVLRTIAQFQLGLNSISLELNEAKCKWVKKGDQFFGMKFLGITVDEWQQLTTATRKGAKEDIRLEPMGSGRINQLLKSLQSRPLTNSEARVADWLHGAKDPTEAMRWAMKQGFFGNLVAIAFDPEKKGILQGRIRSIEALEEYRQSGISEMMLTLTRPGGAFGEVNLNTLSSFAIIKTLRWNRRKGAGRAW